MSQGLANRFADAYALFKAGDYEQSLKLCTSLLKQQPDNTDVLQILGSSQYLLKQFNEACESYRKLSILLQGNKEVLNTYGCILRDQGNFNSAISIFHKALSVDSSYVNAAVNLAYCYHQAGQFDNAVTFYKEITRLFPDNIEYLNYYGDALYQSKKYSEAKDIYQRLSQLDPKSEQFQSRTCWCQYYSSDKEHAISCMKSALQSSSSLYFLLELGKLYLENSQLELATESFSELIKKSGNNAKTLSQIGASYYLKKHYQLAIDSFKLILEFDPMNTDALNNLGVCYDQLNQNPEAIRYFKMLLKAKPTDVATYTAIGAVYQKDDDRATAIEYYKKALELDPHFATALYNIGVALHETGHYAESSNYFIETLKSEPNHEDAAYNLGINYLAAGDYKNGFRYYFKRPRFPMKSDKLTPITPGMSLENKKILFVRSQGLGDELFFLRFIHLAKTDSNKIFYRPDRKLISICERISSIDEVVNLYPEETFDYCFAVDDLPLLLDIQNNSQIPKPLPLAPLPSSSERMAKKLGTNLNTTLMGITWRAGSSKRQPNPDLKYQVLQKSIDLQTFMDAVESYDGKFVILQRSPSSDELSYLEERFGDRVLNMSEVNDNLEDMLALLTLLDRHVGVSNTNIHLRAGLGLPADILVPFPPEWRWQEKTGYSPWFPQFRVHRQTEDESWQLEILSHDNR